MLDKVEALKKEIESFPVSNSDELEKFPPRVPFQEW